MAAPESSAPPLDREAVVRDAMAHSDLRDRALHLGDALRRFRAAGDGAGQVQVLTLLANAASTAADHVGALDYLREAQQLAEASGDARLLKRVRNELYASHYALGDWEAALQSAQADYETDRDADDATTRLHARNCLGCVLIEIGRAAEGLAHVVDSLADLAAVEPEARRLHLHAQSLADLSHGRLLAGDPAGALRDAREGTRLATQISHQALLAMLAYRSGRAALALGDAVLAEEYLSRCLQTAAQLGLGSLAVDAYYEFASVLATLGRPAEALVAYREGHSLERASRRDEAFRRGEFIRGRAEIDKARAEQEQAERVLFAVLPEPIALRLRKGESRIADDIPDVAILFADIVGFTPLAGTMTPRALLDMLEAVFIEFDVLAAHFALDKVKTIGDAYMVVGGALRAGDDYLERCAGMALAMLPAVERVAQARSLPLSIRVGLHAGPVIAGVVGRNRLSYDLWGESVNLASRLESSGTPGRVHVSDAVAHRLQGKFELHSRGAIPIKGYGEQQTWFLGPRREAQQPA